MSKTVVLERGRWQDAEQALNKIELELNKRAIEHREMSTKRDVSILHYSSFLPLVLPLAVMPALLPVMPAPPLYSNLLHPR